MTGLSGDGIRRGTGQWPRTNVVYSRWGAVQGFLEAHQARMSNCSRGPTTQPGSPKHAPLPPPSRSLVRGVAVPLLLTLCGHLTQTTGQPHLTSRYGHSGCGRPRWCLRLVRPGRRLDLSYYATPPPPPPPPLTVRPTGRSLPRKAGGGVTGG